MAELAQTTTAATPEGVAAGSPAIRTVELSKRFGKTVALAGLSMTVPRGEVFGFLGPNGAGKTTSVKLLLGLIAPSSGEGWLLGRPIGDLRTRRKIGYLPELFRYQGWLSAREVLTLHCELAPLPRSSWKDEITSALETVGLADRAGDRVGTFSKGMQQRLGLAVALFALAFGSATAPSALFGMMLAILHYEWVHYIAHIPYAPRTKLGRFIKQYHLRHHFISEKHWFGVSNPTLDGVFGTWRGPDASEKSATTRELWS